MERGDHHRSTPLRVVVLVALVGVGALVLAACGSDAAGSPTVLVPAPAVSTTSIAPATTAVATEPVSTAVSVTDADVADLEKQLDEIDQLLAGVDADLSQD